MAERAGFEPAVHLLRAYNRLAGDRFRPLSHLSVLCSAVHFMNEELFTSSSSLKQGHYANLTTALKFLAEGAGFARHAPGVRRQPDEPTIKP
jgi:hypothetical protein